MACPALTCASSAGTQAEAGPGAPGVAAGVLLGGQGLVQAALLRSIMGGGAKAQEAGGTEGVGAALKPPAQSAAPAGENGSAGAGGAQQRKDGAVAAALAAAAPSLQPQQLAAAAAATRPLSTVVGAGGRVTKLPPSQVRWCGRACQLRVSQAGCALRGGRFRP